MVSVGVLCELLNALAVTLFVVHPRDPPRAVDGSLDSQHILLIDINWEPAEHRGKSGDPESTRDDVLRGLDTRIAGKNGKKS